MHVVAVPIYGLIQGNTVRHVALEAMPIAVFAILGSLRRFTRRERAAATSVGLLTCSAILVHFSHGLIEMHFHFFVMVPIIALYQDWIPFLLAFAYVLVHHWIAGTLSPSSVFDHVWGQRHPLKWAAVHAFFIAGISAVCLVTWRINESALQRERSTEDDLRVEKLTVELLHRIGTLLASELNVGRVAEIVTEEATKATTAAFGAFFYNVLDERGESYMLYTLAGVPREEFEKFPMPRNTAIFAPTFLGTGVVRIDDVQADPRYGHNEPYHGIPPGHLPVRSYLAVPVRSGVTSDVLGGLFFGHPEVGVFTPRHEQIAVGIAGQAAIAFENARLYEAERVAHEEAEATRRHLALYAEAGRVLSASLDEGTALRHLAELTVPDLADVCIIDLIEPDGTFRRAVTASIPELDEHVKTVEKFAPSPTNHAHPAVRVANGGRAEILGPPFEVIRRAAGSDEREAAADRLQPTSVLVAPLVGSELYGTVTFLTHATSGRTFSDDDLSVGEELGRRAGLAVENARLYARQASVAETLQRALLPQRILDIPGLTFAARYIPGGQGDRIGGDWYDVFTVGGGRVAVAMGDVVGHGVRAASLMAQLRNALRALAVDATSPAEVLERLNRFISENEPEALATLQFAFLDPVSNEVRIASAGHPPALVVTADGTSSYVDGSNGPPLGATAFARYSDRNFDLPPGHMLALYTDGLVEDRRTTLDTGLERLRRCVQPEADLERVADRIMNGCAIGPAEDDTAVLLVRSEAIGPRLELHLPADPKILAGVRQTIRRWLRENQIDADIANDILIACGEAANNAIEHGSRAGAGWFDFLAEVGDDLSITVVNQAAWRERSERRGGRGLPMMQALMDDVTIEEEQQGVTLRMRRSLTATHA